MLWVRGLIDSPGSRNYGHHYIAWLKRGKKLLVWVIGRLEKAQIWEIMILLHFYMYILIMHPIKTTIYTCISCPWYDSNDWYAEIIRTLFSWHKEKKRRIMSWYKKQSFFSTDCSWSHISINLVKCKSDFFWLVEVNVKILNKLLHTSTIYSDSVDLWQQWNSEIQNQTTLHQSPKPSLER